MTSVSCLMLCSWPNRAAFIADASLSYALQSHADRELVVVNDGAPLASMREDVRVVNISPGLSIGAKRNVALAHADGEYVATWDDDDFSFPERLVEMLARVGEGGACCDRMWLADQDLRLVGVVRCASYPTAVLRRDAALAVGGYPHVSYAEDMGLSMKLKASGRPVALVDRPLYVHRRHGENVTAARASIEKHLRQATPTPRLLTSAAQARVDILRAAPKPVLVAPC